MPLFSPYLLMLGVCLQRALFYPLHTPRDRVLSHGGAAQSKRQTLAEEESCVTWWVGLRKG